MTPLLTAAIASNDIGPRLIYADYLEPREPDTAELIRLACEIKSWESPTDLIDHTKFEELRPAIEAPLLRSIDAAWPVCWTCDGLGEIERETGPGDIVQPDTCPTCHGLGRIGKLWRECPPCHGKGKIPYEMPAELDKRCRPCDGFGVLLEVPCPNDTNRDGDCHLCYPGSGFALRRRGDCKTGYIPSPIVPLYQLWRLLYDPRAYAIRRGDTTVLLNLLSQE
jgi:uncharacterized protein (TIGR02996 family)